MSTVLKKKHQQAVRMLLFLHLWKLLTQNVNNYGDLAQHELGVIIITTFQTHMLI